MPELNERQAVHELTERRFDRKLALRSVGKYIKRWVLTPQKLPRKAYEQQPAALRNWLEEDFPATLARARVQGAEIQWGAESGVPRRTSLRRRRRKGRFPISLVLVRP
jgi:hypothetical protein